jgi:hypothetical protein
MFLDIIHHPVFIFVYISKQNVSETGFCFRLQVKPNRLDPIDNAIPNLRTGAVWAQLSWFSLKTGDRIQSPKRCVMKYKQYGVLDKNMTMDDVQKHNIYTNVPLLQTFIL